MDKTQILKTFSVGLFEFVRLQQELSDLLGCRVDMATPVALHKNLKKHILKEAIRAAQKLEHTLHRHDRGN